MIVVRVVPHSKALVSSLPPLLTPLYRFFNNKGAVAGVFLIVGLAAASIILFLFFCIRRRRRTRRLEHETTVASALAAAGLNRTPLDGDMEGHAASMSQRNSTPASTNPFADTTTSLPLTTGRPPSTYLDDPTAGPEPPTPGAPGGATDFDPYAAYGTIHPPPPATLGFPRRDGYAPAPTSSPPPGAYTAGHPGHGHSYSSRSDSSSGFGHRTQGSVSSHDLLLGYTRDRQASESAPVTPATPTAALSPSSGDLLTPPPRNPRRLADAGKSASEEAAEPAAGVRDSTTSSVYSMAEEGPFEDPRASKPALEVR